MNQPDEKQMSTKGEPSAKASEESCTGAPLGPNAAAKEAPKGTAPMASFEDFNLDDIEVVESKVFA